MIPFRRKASRAKGTGKYNTRKIVRFGHEFDSMLEVGFFIFLTGLQNDGKIASFDVKPEKFLLNDTVRYMGTTYPKTTYTPDFRVVLNDGTSVYVDTKSPATAKKESYRIKLKLFLRQHIIGKSDLYFLEVFQNSDFEEFVRSVSG